MNAIDLNKGEILWKVALGEYPELIKRGLPATGTPNLGGPVTTAGGLVFIAATKDEKFRAFDKMTGQLLWEYKLPFGGFATPGRFCHSRLLFNRWKTIHCNCGRRRKPGRLSIGRRICSVSFKG